MKINKKSERPMRTYNKGYTKDFKQEQFHHPSFQGRNMMSHKNFVLWCQKSVAPYIKPTLNGNQLGHWKIKELFLNRIQGSATRTARQACWETENSLAKNLLKVPVPTTNTEYTWEQSAIECANLIKRAYDSLENNPECYIELKPQNTIDEYDYRRGLTIFTSSEPAESKLVTKISAELVRYCEQTILKGQTTTTRIGLQQGNAPTLEQKNGIR